MLDERRRIAVELHDLVMQEIAFSIAMTRRLAADTEPAAEDFGSAIASAERALAGARQIVDGLARRSRPPVAELVGASVRTAARETRLSFDATRVAPGECADAQTCEALVHIGREAVTNAVKHACTESIEVVLAHGEEWLLRVRDCGGGFDGRRSPGGFGLQSMREHAAALGGCLRVVSVAGAGTTIEAVLP